jgi:hypothetical protein
VGVGGVLIGRTLKTHTVKDLWSWLELVRDPLTLFALATLCIALAVVVVIFVYARNLWRWSDLAMKKSQTSEQAMEGYKHTDQALRSIVARFKFAKIAGLDHPDVPDPLSVAEEILARGDDTTERTSS